MRRSFEEEILDGGGHLPEMLARAHRALSLTQSLLGNHAAILRALRREGAPVRRVLDIGCGHGGLLEKVQRQIGAEVLGVDLRPPECSAGEFPRRYNKGADGGWGKSESDQGKAASTAKTQAEDRRVGAACLQD